MVDNSAQSEHPIDFLKRLEESLRTAKRDNGPSGLTVTLPDDTVTAWVESLRNLLESIEHD